MHIFYYTRSLGRSLVTSIYTSTTLLADQLLKITRFRWLLHVGCCVVYRHTFRSFFKTFGAKVLGTFAPEKRKFQGAKILETFAPEEWKFQRANVPQNKSYTGAKVLSVDFSLPRVKVQGNKKSVVPDTGPCNLPNLTVSHWILPWHRCALCWVPIELFFS